MEAGRGRGRQAEADPPRCLGAFADPALGLVLVKAGFGVQLCPSPVKPSPAEAATNCGLLAASDKLPRASHRQHLTLVCTRAPSRRSETSIPSGWFRTSKQEQQASLFLFYSFLNFFFSIFFLFILFSNFLYISYASLSFSNSIFVSYSFPPFFF